jgi:hypothetical protein
MKVQDLNPVKPIVVWAMVAQHDIDFVISENALRSSCVGEKLNQIGNTRTVGTTINQVTDENESTAMSVNPVVSIT